MYYIQYQLPSNVTWGVFDWVRLHCWKYTMSKNQPINDEYSRIHSVPSVLPFWIAQVENTQLDCSAVLRRCLIRERMQK